MRSPIGKSLPVQAVEQNTVLNWWNINSIDLQDVLFQEWYQNTKITIAISNNTMF